jgi:hypothetical protein
MESYGHCRDHQQDRRSGLEDVRKRAKTKPSEKVLTKGTFIGRTGPLAASTRQRPLETQPGEENDPAGGKRTVAFLTRRASFTQRGFMANHLAQGCTHVCDRGHRAVLGGAPINSSALRVHTVPQLVLRTLREKYEERHPSSVHSFAWNEAVSL